MSPPVGPRERLRELGLGLPPVPAPRGRYRPWLRAGSLVVTAGVIAADQAGVRTGRVGDDLDVEAAREAARVAALALLAILDEAAGGLDRIAQLLLLHGYVRSAPGFGEQPRVVDAASELLAAVLDEAGLHARVALGVSELPLGAAVELQAWAEVAGG